MLDSKKPILIVGYGKMGKAIKKLSEDTNPSITIDSSDAVCSDYKSLEEFIKEDRAKKFVSIDFSAPSEVINNIELYAKYKINAVIGTTGWYDKFNYVEKLVEKSGIGLVYSANFSDSVQMAFIANRVIAAMANSMKGWDVAINEVHHNKKLYASGTAKTFANDIIKNKKLGKTHIADSINGGKPDDAITIGSDRLQGIFGEHTIRYAHESGDRVDLFHHANNRDGFATGAINAAEFIRGNFGMYDFADIAKGRYIAAIIREFGIQKIIR